LTRLTVGKKFEQKDRMAFNGDQQQQQQQQQRRRH
jgi:hypothetical protein